MRVIIVIMVCVLISCNRHIPKAPEHLIPREKMILVLQDIALVNAAKSIDKKLLETHQMMPVEFIYKKHHIDSAQFALSNGYYAHDIKAYKKMYLEVESNLKKMKKHFEAVEKAEKVKDSIKKANKVSS